MSGSVRSSATPSPSSASRAGPTGCASTSPNTPHAPVRSYRVRRGRTGPTALAARQRLWPVYGLEPPYPGLEQFRLLEIGFGMGEATALMATADPRPLLAVEVHPAGITALLRRLDAAQLDQVRVINADAVEVVTAMAEHSLDEVRVFFPDPWPKTRHAKRRLLRPAFATLLASRLAPDGFLHLTTDSPGYVEHAREALAGWDLRFVPRPEHRPVTGYERRAMEAGRPVTDVLARPPGRP